MQLKMAYDDFEPESLATGLSMWNVDPKTGEMVEDKGMTQQEFLFDSDINEIVRRFGLTGKLPDDLRVPLSGDFTGIEDYHSAILAVRKAEEAFMEMPAELRARFNNDPQILMDFLADGTNRNEAVKLGLVQALVPPERSAVTAIDELAAKWDVTKLATK